MRIKPSSGMHLEGFRNRGMIIILAPEFVSYRPILLSMESKLQAFDAFQQAPRVERPPATLCLATAGLLPASQGQRGDGLVAAFTAIALPVTPALGKHRVVGVFALPPPAPIAVARGAGIVGAGQLQADASPAQHDESSGHGAAAAVGNAGRIHGTVVHLRHQRLPFAQVALGGLRWRRCIQRAPQKPHCQPWSQPPGHRVGAARPPWRSGGCFGGPPYRTTQR